MKRHGEMKNGFWTSTSQYGVMHRIAEADAASPMGVLAVFVHGIFGDCRGTWGKMPEWVLEHARRPVDVASFAYPAQLWQRTSIPQAADDLRTWLETELRDYRHILFVTHSTGGLVVKQLLSQASIVLHEQFRTENFDLAACPSVWLRTRHVINIAVPHAGGSPFITALAKASYRYVAYPLLAPWLKLVRFLSQGAKDWGWNDIIVALRWQNPWLLQLEEGFLQQLKEGEVLDIPSPLIHDVYAKSDLSVPVAAKPRERDIYFRGTHGSVKVPTHPTHPIVSIVAGLVRHYGSEMGLTVTDHTLARIVEVNRVTGTRALIGANGAGDGRPTATIKTKACGTQQEVCDMVVGKVRSSGERPRRMIVTGAAGVGKSTVLRMIAWRLGRSYLGNPRDEPLPLLLPLQQVTLDRASESAFSWEAMWQWWTQWRHNLYPHLTWDAEAWLEERFRKGATTVILDGLDDFLVNNPSIGLSFFVNLLYGVGHRYESNPRLAIIVGIRSGLHGLERIAGDPRDIYEVLRLSLDQAEQVFPSCRRWLPQVQDDELRELILTPLILSNYEPDLNEGVKLRSLTKTSLLDQTIRTILQRSHLIGALIEPGLAAAIDHLLFALTLTAWLFFYQHRGEIDATALREEAKVIRSLWEGFSQDKGLTPEAEDLLAGFRLLEEREVCDALLQRTVFVATGPNKYRFSHRSWQEYLLARYFYLCFLWGYVEDFGATAFNSHIYRMVGDLFQGKVITEDRIAAILAAWRRSHNTYITGNVIAFLAWTKTAVEARALRLLLEELPNYEPLSRVVLIAGLGYRVLVNDPDDHSLGDLRRALVPKLQEFSSPATIPVSDPVSSSLAWCYLKAFAGLLGLPQPETAWPAVGFDDEATLKALPMVCTMHEGELTLDARSRSLQLAFLVPILDAYDDPNLAIRALHYLYYLVVARKHGVHVFELSQELPQLLAPGCRFEKIVASFTVVPELRELYRRCQDLHKNLESAAL